VGDSSQRGGFIKFAVRNVGGGCYPIGNAQRWGFIKYAVRIVRDFIPFAVNLSNSQCETWEIYPIRNAQRWGLIQYAVRNVGELSNMMCATLDFSPNSQCVRNVGGGGEVIKNVVSPSYPRMGEEL
jgi:hypothetical protein